MSCGFWDAVLLRRMCLMTSTVANVVKRVRQLLLVVAVLLLAAACSGVSVRTVGVGDDAAWSASGPLPMSPAMAKRLPAGTFYLAAGANDISANIWEVSSTGRETQLTRNGHNFGISNFGASTAGVVMGDGAGGADVLAALTAKGPMELRDGGDGDAPAINAAGQICYVRTIFDKDGNTAYQELIVRNSLNGPGRVVYKIKVSDNVAGLLTPQWGPDGSIAVVDGGHYPGGQGPESKLVTVSKSGRVRSSTAPPASTRSRRAGSRCHGAPRATGCSSRTTPSASSACGPRPTRSRSLSSGRRQRTSSSAKSSGCLSRRNCGRHRSPPTPQPPGKTRHSRLVRLATAAW
jgi:hypothetical protein